MGLYIGCNICNYALMANTTNTPLARYRRDADKTLTALARAFDVNKSTILRWERGDVPIPVARLAEIEAKTGIPRSELRPDVFMGAA